MDALGKLLDETTFAALAEKRQVVCIPETATAEQALTVRGYGMDGSWMALLPCTAAQGLPSSCADAAVAMHITESKPKHAADYKPITIDHAIDPSCALVWMQCLPGKRRSRYSHMPTRP